MVGRKDERARLKALLDAAREGRSGALLLHGPARDRQDGAAALRDRARPTDFRLLRARGMESESDIPFAGLAELVTPLLGAPRRDPAVQAAALRGALALGPADARRSLHGARRAALAARPRGRRAARAGGHRRHPVARRAVAGGVPVRRPPARRRRAWRCSAPIRDDARRLEVPWLDGWRSSRCADDEARALLDAQIAPGVADRLVATAAGQPARAAGDPRPAVGRRSSPGASRSRTRCGPGPASSARSRSRSRRCRRPRGARCWSRPRRARGGWTRSAGARRTRAVARRPRAGRGGADRRAGRAASSSSATR